MPEQSERNGYNYDYYAELFDFYAVSYDMIHNYDIVAQLIKMLDKDFYAIVYLDNKYIADDPSCAEGFIHSLLIYGYDDEKEEFYALKMVNGKFDSYSCSFEGVAQGYQHFFDYPYVMEHDTPLLFFKPKEFQSEYPFSAQRFLQELKNYINGENSSKNTFYFQQTDLIYKDVLTYGIQHLDTYISYCEQQKDSMSRMHFYFLYEHRENLLHKFSRFLDYEDPLMISYGEIVSLTKILLNKYIKMRMIQSMDWSFLVEYLQKIKHAELELMPKIYTAIKNKIRKETEDKHSSLCANSIPISKCGQKLDLSQYGLIKNIHIYNHLNHPGDYIVIINGEAHPAVGVGPLDSGSTPKIVKM